jgi:hypothetical protein
MGEKIPVVASDGKQSLTARLEKIRDLQEKKLARKIPSRLIADALIEEGYLSLDAQAKALGLNRSTVWTIMKATQKLGRLNSKTALCILANPSTPVSVRAIIDAMFDTKTVLQAKGNDD